MDEHDGSESKPPWIPSVTLIRDDAASRSAALALPKHGRRCPGVPSREACRRRCSGGTLKGSSVLTCGRGSAGVSGRGADLYLMR